MTGRLDPLFAGLVFLMGVAPLSAWGHSTVKTLGRAIWKPALFSLAIGLILPFLLGVRSWPALLVFGCLHSLLLSPCMNFAARYGARARSHGENYFAGVVADDGRNRRRYGGYTIHLGVVFMAIGIIGIEIFQTETQGTIARAVIVAGRLYGHLQISGNI